MRCPRHATVMIARPAIYYLLDDRAGVDVCRVQCIYEFNPSTNPLFSSAEAGSGEIASTRTPTPDAIGICGDSVWYVNRDESTSCTACYQPDVCPVGAIYADEHVPDGTPNRQVQRGRHGHGRRPHVRRPTLLRRLRRLKPSTVVTN